MAESKGRVIAVIEFDVNGARSMFEAEQKAKAYLKAEGYRVIGIPAVLKVWAGVVPGVTAYQKGFKAGVKAEARRKAKQERLIAKLK
jgi:hypothetical protein